jgi:hypothetical protein
MDKRRCLQVNPVKIAEAVPELNKQVVKQDFSLDLFPFLNQQIGVF